MKTLIVDYGMGNVGSIRNMLRHLGHEAEIRGEPEAIAAADRLILAGVGAFDHGVQNLRSRGLIEPLREHALVRARPVLGICLGMQLMTRRSEEGVLPGLGWIAADTVRFRFADRGLKLRIPHMGWNEVRACKPSPILEGLPPEPRFYFVHSYHALCDDAGDALLEAHYGYGFAAAFSRGAVCGVQFHPEKSHKFGMALLRNFLERT